MTQPITADVPRAEGAPAPVRRPPLVTASGASNTVVIGNPSQYLNDLYHYLMIAPWPTFLALIGGGYLVGNLVFALLFLAGGDCIAGARAGSFADAFFFSVQTMATIGYGSMAPTTFYANLLVSTEALFGLLCIALATGLMFAKFSRPTARVHFSKVALINTRDGKPHLVFRVANVRANQIVEATMRLAALQTETTAEGEQMRRFRELHLVRHQNPLFALTWTVLHPIDEHSPLHGMTTEMLSEREIYLIAMLVGIDGTLSQTIHARHVYSPEDIVVGARFVDMVKDLPDGRRGIDLRVLHEHVPARSAG